VFGVAAAFFLVGGFLAVRGVRRMARYGKVMNERANRGT